jgi:hypothetical protein
MEKRRSKRISAHLNAQLHPGLNSPAGIMDLKTKPGITWYKHEGVIENLSKSGMYVRIVPSESSIVCTNGATMKISFELLTREALELDCRIIWSHTNPSSARTVMGMKIIKPTKEYKKFVKARLKQHH